MDFITQLKATHGISLNPQQEQAVRSTDGAVLLLAVPGSGKTTVLIARLANMIQAHGIPPHKILTVTYSRKSAADMAARYRRFFGSDNQPHFSTIHSFCNGVVEQIAAQYQRPMPRLVKDPTEIVRGIYCKLEGVRYVERETLDELVTAIALCKNRLSDADEIGKIKVEDCDFPRLYNAYREYLSENKQMDYDDMLLFTYDMFRKNPAFLKQYQDVFSHICVDEAQDTSLVQHKIIALLAQKSGNLFMVGDEDQSIYGFRGAYPEALLGFGAEHPSAQILKMEQNYRSTGEVVRAANLLIWHNKARIPKRIFTARESGTPVAVHEVVTQSAQYDKVLELLSPAISGTTAVLYRNNDSAVPLIDALDRAGIPFSLKDARDTFFQTIHVRDMVAFLKLSINSTDLDSFSRIYSKTNAYLSRAVLDFVVKHHKAGESVFSTLRRCPTADGGRVENLQKQIAKLKTLSPANALNSLENLASRSYFDSESASRRLTLLKSIAAKQESVEALLARLDALAGIMKNSSASGGVILSTIHSSKGLEYDRVLMIDLIEGQFPSKTCTELLRRGERTLYEEEVRLCYVAATRARDELHLITFAEGSRACRPSRFVRLLTVEPQKKTAKPAESTPSVKTPHPRKEFEGYTVVTDAAQLHKGMQVLHDQFGVGRILRIENGCMTWFDGAVTKRLFLKTCIENGNLFLKCVKEPDIYSNLTND